MISPIAPVWFSAVSGKSPANNAMEYSAASPAQIRIVRAVHFQDGPQWNHPFNRYPYNTLYFVMGGDGFVTINGKTTALEAGYVYLIPPDTTFSCWCETAIEKLYVDVFAEIVPGCDLFSERNTIARKAFDQEAILRLCNAEARGTLSDQLFLLGAVTQVLAEFAQEGPLPVSREILRFRPLLEEMDRQLSAQLRVSSIARQLGWEPSTLSRSFKKTFGCTAKEYLEHLLMNRLRQELIGTDLSIKEIAARYQFCDPYYLSAFFRRREGSSPSVYRKTHRRI